MRSGWGRYVLPSVTALLGVLTSLVVNLLTASWDLRWWLASGVLTALIVIVEWLRSRAAGPVRPPWVRPAPPSGVIPRADLVDRVVAEVTADGGGPRVVTLFGPPGFGKTTLARMVLADPRISRAFGKHVELVEIGQGVHAANLASRCNDLIYRLSGERPAYADPVLAGRHLAGVLQQTRRGLLVIDNVWDERQLEPLTEGGEGWVRLVTTRMATELYRGAARVPVGRAIDAYPGHEERTGAVAVAPDGAWFASSGRDGTVQIRSWDSAEPIAVYPGHAGREGRLFGGDPIETTKIAIASDATWLAVVDQEGHAHLVDTATGELLTTLFCADHDAARAGPEFAVAIAPDDRWLATGGDDGHVRIWSADTAALLATLPRHGGLVGGLDISPDGHWLASVGADHEIRIWETGAWTCVTLLRVDAYLHHCRWSPDGRLLAVTGTRGVHLLTMDALGRGGAEPAQSAPRGDLV